MTNHLTNNYNDFQMFLEILSDRLFFSNLSQSLTMDARAKTIREILHAGDQYLIPFFQRQYSWGKKNWTRLFDDLTNLLDDDHESSQHFLGPLVCTPTNHVPGEVPAYQLIDGQQRITTLTVLLCALRDVAREHQQIELAEEITEDYLIHKRKKGLQRYKIVPRLGDRELLTDIIDEKKTTTIRQKFTRRSNFFNNRSPTLRTGLSKPNCESCLSQLLSDCRWSSLRLMTRINTKSLRALIQRACRLKSQI